MLLGWGFQILFLLVYVLGKFKRKFPKGSLLAEDFCISSVESFISFCATRHDERERKRRKKPDCGLFPVKKPGGGT